MIRIVHVALQLDTGGLERLLVEFARRADRTRFELSFLSLGGGGPIADEITALGWPVTIMNIKKGVRPLLIHRLTAMFRQQRIDIVHTHNTKPMLYAAPAARLAGVGGVVHTRHGQRHGATRRQGMLFRGASRCVDRLVCVSNDAARCCRDEGLGSAAIRTIWNGIDLDRFSFNATRERGIAVFVGRLSVEKDVSTLVRAMALIAATDRSLRLKIAGSGPCEATLRALADELRVGDHVEFVGEVSDIPGLLSSASMLVLPSKTEGLSLSVLEAMASGVPIVATRVGGTPEPVIDGTTGLLVAPGDADSLAQAMLRLHEDPALSARMALAGRERAVANFGVELMVSNYESLYEEILAGSARRTA